MTKDGPDATNRRQKWLDVALLRYLETGAHVSEISQRKRHGSLLEIAFEIMQ
jgi:hypothetical protein